MSTSVEERLRGEAACGGELAKFSTFMIAHFERAVRDGLLLLRPLGLPPVVRERDLLSVTSWPLADHRWTQIRYLPQGFGS
jgi:hypothetical protein